MKEYIEPIVEVIELSGEDIIVTSSSPKGTGSDTETKREGGLLGFTSKNNLPFE